MWPPRPMFDDDAAFNLEIDRILIFAWYHQYHVPPVVRAAQVASPVQPRANVPSQARRRVRMPVRARRMPPSRAQVPAPASVASLPVAARAGQRPGELPAVTSQAHAGLLQTLADGTCRSASAQAAGRGPRFHPRAAIKRPLCSDGKLPGPNRQALASVEGGTAIYHDSAAGVLDNGDDNDC